MRLVVASRRWWRRGFDGARTMGTSQGRLSPTLLVYHPKLLHAVADEISPATKDYNCIAFALGITNQRWQPEPESGDYWPPDVPQEDTLEAWLALFEKYKFIRCNDGNYESGFEKIVIYTHDGQPLHVARLTPLGKWQSKMGHCEDIFHR